MNKEYVICMSNHTQTVWLEDMYDGVNKSIGIWTTNVNIRKEYSDISDVISDYVKLTKNSDNHNIWIGLR